MSARRIKHYTFELSTSKRTDEAFAIEPTLDGGFVITGASNFTAIDSQTLLIKTNADGNTVPAPITSN